MSINKCHVAVKLPLFYIVHAKSNALYSLYYFTLLQNIASVVWNRLSNIQLIVILFFSSADLEYITLMFMQFFRGIFY